jgi:hypothetical protein
MILNNQKTSLLIDSQLPEFVRDNPDYGNFRLFLQAYYEWMEQEGKVTNRTKNLISYKDVDETTDEFLNYFTNEFLPYFPQDTLIDKQQAIKVARQLYQTKGTPASYQFLFKVLFNSDFDLFYTKDAVLKASAGTWYVAKSLKLATYDPNFQNIDNYRLFGETTKSIATVEKAFTLGTKTEVFISNIQRLFQSGETVRVVDNANQTVLFDGQPLRAKIVGQISQIKIDPKNRGLLYVTGDPVVVYGGLNSSEGIGATAVISETTSGSIRSIGVVTSGYGYSAEPNTHINITNAPGAYAIVGSLDPRGMSNVAFLPSDTIGLKKDIILGNSNYYFANTTISNTNTTLAEALSFVSFTTYPISSIVVTNGGGGIRDIPEITAQSGYQTDLFTYASIPDLGILSPIQISNGGHGYRVNDKIVFSGGLGRGAYANVKTVAANGYITGVSYVLNPTPDYPLGGMGYTSTDLPTLSVQSANNQAGGASLYVPGILGTGATFLPTVDRAGSITTISITDPGEDYVSAPTISLKVQDITVSNVSISNLPTKGNVIYQGANTNVATYMAMVDSLELLAQNQDPLLSVWNLRVFNYNSNPDKTKTLNIDRAAGANVYLNMTGTKYDNSYTADGYKNYGDGTAKASASFLNGLVISQGEYLTTQGQPSGYDLLQDDVYNNYTYKITVEKEIEKYRDVLLNLLHPSGINVIGRYALKSNTAFNHVAQEGLSGGHTLSYYTNNIESTITITTDFTNKSNNIVKVKNLSGANLYNFIDVGNSYISIVPLHGSNVFADIISVNTTANTITLSSNVWLTFANVARITGSSSTNTINITSLTGGYDIINNGVYSNVAYPLMDIVYSGDNVLVANNTSKTVDYVDYINGIIYLTSNLTSNANSYLSVNRTFTANGADVKISAPIGQQYTQI